MFKEGSQIHSILKLVEENKDGISVEDIKKQLGIDRAFKVYNMISILRRKHKKNIIQEHNLYRMGEGKPAEEKQSHEFHTKEHATAHPERHLHPKIKLGNVVEKMSENDKLEYLEFRRKAIFYTRAAEGLIESYQQTSL